MISITACGAKYKIKLVQTASFLHSRSMIHQVTTSNMAFDDNHAMLSFWNANAKQTNKMCITLSHFRSYILTLSMRETANGYIWFAVCALLTIASGTRKPSHFRFRTCNISQHQQVAASEYRTTQLKSLPKHQDDPTLARC